MKRKEFLKMLGASSLGLGLTRLVDLGVRNEQPYTGTFYIMINTSGGWDPTSLCDPKGSELASSDPMNHYIGEMGGADSQVSTVGPFKVAPNINYPEINNADPLLKFNANGFNRQFYQRYQNDLLVLNGVDTGTNSHDTGTRHTWCGSIVDGFPAFAALVAASKAKAKPMAFITNGGYDDSDGLLAPTRLQNQGELEEISYPNKIRYTNLEDSENYFDDFTSERLARARADRQMALQKEQRIGSFRESMTQLFVARSGNNELRRLIDELETLDALDITGQLGHINAADFTGSGSLADYISGANSVNGSLSNTRVNIYNQGRVAMAAYKAGLAVSVNINVGGFDTHGNHDNSHMPLLEGVLQGIDLLMIQAQMMGIANKVCISVGSDFGRTPGYNSGNGKDHWSITSMLFMGAGIQGGRVIGQTDENHTPLLINPKTFQPDDNGSRITPAIIHRALRHISGVEGTNLANRYPIASEVDMDLFG